MEPTHIFINGCSFLTYRSKDGIMTHAGKELEKLMTKYGSDKGGKNNYHNYSNYYSEIFFHKKKDIKNLLRSQT